MADRTQYLEFTVYLATKAEAEAEQAKYPNGVRTSPAIASQLYNAPIVLHDDTAPFFAPSIRSPYFTSTNKYNRNLTTALSECRGGWFGICSLFGRSTFFLWVAKFAYASPGEGGGGDEEPIQPRSWIDGFEIGADMFGAGGNGVNLSRASSRHADGYGYAFRSNDGGGSYIQHSVTENGAAARASSWERFYLRLRSVPNISTVIWQTQGATSILAGIHLEITPTLSLAVYNVNNAGTRNLIATGGFLDIDELGSVPPWVKVDILLSYGAGTIKVHLKGVLVIDAAVPAGQGLGQAQNHSSSRLGNGGITGPNTLEVDFDDWICSPIPPSFDGLDWVNGSKVVAVLPTTFGTGNAWTGTVQALQRNPFRAIAAASTANLQNAVSGAALVVNTDATDTIDKVIGSLGCAAMRVQITRSTVSGSTPGQLGYSIGGGAAVMQNVTEGPSSFAQAGMMYRPAGQITPAPVTPLVLRYTKSPFATNQIAYQLAAEAELLGVFGSEDVIADGTDEPTAKVPPKLGPHNGPYPRSIWATTVLPPTAPVIIVGGTYVGNGTSQDLQFRAPVNWFISRRSSGGSEQGARWWSSMLASHLGNEQGTFHEGMIRAEEDTSFVPVGGDNNPEERYLVRVVGSHAALNAAAITYQYIAVIDPGGRFMLNGGMAHDPAQTNDALNRLKNAAFLPQGIYMVKEDTSSTNTANLGFKGPGSLPNGWTRLEAVELDQVMSMATAVITTYPTNGHTPSGRSMSFNAWRMDDGSADPGIPKVVKIGTYTGNGSASRTITLAPASGVRPLFVEVIPANGSNTIRRDPSHTGTTSSTAAGAANATTGIISGDIDAFTVGSALNASAIVYNYFVLMGSATAGNGGWSVNGEFIPVEPDYAFDDPDAPDDPSEIPEPIPGGGGGGGEEPPVEPPGSECEDGGGGEQCIAMSTRVSNLALIEIGVTKVLTNYCTQSTKEAELVRQVYDQCVRHTLITYPWPFATKYAVLALIATQPTDEDWQFAYRMPADCIFPRRIVVARGTAVDPSPPPMGLSSDDAGGIILTNEASATLEYTARPSCVAVVADELFREALKWRLAAALAPPLTRIPGEADRCLKMFEIIIQKAESVIKQGVPGDRPTASTLDVTGPAIVANIQVVNRALVRIGARTIANLTLEQSREAVAANLVFEDELRSTLRDHPWAFATRYVDPMVLVGGTPAAPVNADWIYSHRLPADLLTVRRLALAGTGRKFDPSPGKYRLGSDVTGGLLFSDLEAPIIEYTARLQNVLTYADAIFRDALAWRLAAALAPSLANVELHRPEQLGRGPETPQDPSARHSRRFNDQQRRTMIAQWAWAMYERALDEAKVADRNEAQLEPLQDAEWIRGRN